MKETDVEGEKQLWRGEKDRERKKTKKDAETRGGRERENKIRWRQNK